MSRGFAALFSSLCLVVALGLLTGCASYNAQLPPTGKIQGRDRFFVLSNLNDNHAIAEQIVAALKARGKEAESGPATMMPDDTQVVLAYEQHWSWDFGDHLVYLQISARDRRTVQQLGTVRFSTRVPTRRSTPTIISELLDQLLAGSKS